MTKQYCRALIHTPSGKVVHLTTEDHPITRDPVVPYPIEEFEAADFILNREGNEFCPAGPVLRSLVFDEGENRVLIGEGTEAHKKGVSIRNLSEEEAQCAATVNIKKRSINT